MPMHLDQIALKLPVAEANPLFSCMLFHGSPCLWSNALALSVKKAGGDANAMIFACTTDSTSATFLWMLNLIRHVRTENIA